MTNLFATNDESNHRRTYTKKKPSQLWTTHLAYLHWYKRHKMLSKPAPKLIRMWFYNPFYDKIHVLPIKKRIPKKKIVSLSFVSQTSSFFEIFSSYARTHTRTDTIRYVTSFSNTFFLLLLLLSTDLHFSIRSNWLSDFFPSSSSYFLDFIFPLLFPLCIHFADIHGAHSAQQRIPCCTYARFIGAIFDRIRIKHTDNIYWTQRTKIWSKQMSLRRSDWDF